MYFHDGKWQHELFKSKTIPNVIALMSKMWQHDKLFIYPSRAQVFFFLQKKADRISPMFLHVLLVFVYIKPRSELSKALFFLKAQSF